MERRLCDVDGCKSLEKSFGGRWLCRFGKDVLHSSDDVVVGVFVCWCGL